MADQIIIVRANAIAADIARLRTFLDGGGHYVAAMAVVEGDNSIPNPATWLVIAQSLKSCR